jgi:F-type H+-transporting ATPase subunit b
MRSRSLLTASGRAVLLVLGPSLAWASEAAGEATRSPGFDLLMKFVNFGILAGILFYFLRKPVSQSLADRQQAIRNELEEARKAKQDAEAKYQEVKQRLAALEEEIRKIGEDFRAEGARQRERIVDDGRQAAESVRQQAQAAGSNEVKRAVDELRSQAADLALHLTIQRIEGTN